ncbi:MAG: lysophospholipid acyltransferase family protein, partial [Acidobacteriota bacterium]
RDLVELTERTLASRNRTADSPAVAEGVGLDWGEILAEPDTDSPDLRRVLTRTPAMRLVSYLIQRPINWLARIFLRLEVVGREELLKLPAPFLICPNHQSYLDSFLVCSTYPRQILDLTFHVGARMYFASRWTAWLARSINVVPVDANVNLLRAMRAGAAGLRAGKILNIYPEGHRTYDGQLHDFKLGAAILATELNLPIVPVAIDGAWRVLPRDSNRLRLAKVRITFGKPVYPVYEPVKGPVNGGDGYQEMTNEVKRRIQEMLGQG